MRAIRIRHADLVVSRIAYGCMKIGARRGDADGTATKDASFRALAAARDAGIDFFDHADIYAGGESESVFGQWLAASPGLRDRVVIQSKCGIRLAGRPRPEDPQRYDFSRAHILESVEGSLRRLRTDRLDLLLLHRPDPLAEPAEVARAFDELHDAGKVRHFGVSNHTRGQIEVLQRHVRRPLAVNQVELSLTHAHLIDAGIVANRAGASGALAEGTLDFCRVHDITVQAWGPVGGGRLLAADPAEDSAWGRTARLLNETAARHGAPPEAVLVAWLLRHPAGLQPVIGSTRPERIEAACRADAIDLSREEWYALFTAARGARVP
jgi:predicted oxidoreductase